MAARPKRSGSRKKRPNWARARKRYEVEGLSFAHIAELEGCNRNTVAEHARKEHWVKASVILAQTGPERVGEIARRFITQDAEAIAANLTRKHKLTSDILDFVEEGLTFVRKEFADSLKAQAEWDAAFGHLSPAERLQVEAPDRPRVYFPGLDTRRMALTTQSIEGVDSRLAGLSESGWRSSEAAAGSDLEEESERVQRALEEAERAGP